MVVMINDIVVAHVRWTFRVLTRRLHFYILQQALLRQVLLGSVDAGENGGAPSVCASVYSRR
jgi:hypothetical protein